MIINRTKSSGSGASCVYVKIGNGKGWKLFKHKNEARLARHAQIWFGKEYGAAPKVYSKKIIKVKAYIKQEAKVALTYWGFITEDIISWTASKRKYENQICDALKKMQDLVDQIDSNRNFDIHIMNIGLQRKTLKPMVLDFSYHFYDDIPYGKIKDKRNPLRKYLKENQD